MFIYRNKIETERGYKGIRLTTEEMYQIYAEVQRILDMHDIEKVITSRIRETQQENHYAKDWPERIADTVERRYRKRVDGDREINQAKRLIIEDIVSEELRRLDVADELFGGAKNGEPGKRN